MSNLPYDAQIEYIEFTGTQWIDTGVYGDLNTRVKIQCNTSTDKVIVFGSRESATSKNISVQTNGGKVQVDFGDYSVTRLDTAYGGWIEIDNSKSLRSVTALPNGTPVTNTTAYSTAFTTPETLKIGKWTSNYPTGYTNFIGKIGVVQIWENDVLVRDFIPVRVGGTGYLYDKVSGEFFGNDGTGEFILGKDKALPNPFGFRRRLMMVGGDIEFCDYIYTTSDNKAYIDTGILPSESLRVEGNMAFVVWSAWYIIFGTRTGTDSNEFTLQAYNNNRVRAIYGNSYTTSQLPNVGINMFSVDWNGNIVNINGTTYTFGSKTFSTPYTLYLFGLNNAGAPSLFPSKIWSCKMWENGVIVRDYRPAKRKSTGKYGLYDMVSRQLFLSPNGVDFLGGND